MTKTQKPNEKQTAEYLYHKGALTQKQIAKKVGVTEKTLSRWAKSWKPRKSGLSEAVINCINRLNDKLKDPKATAYEIKTLTDTLETLEKARYKSNKHIS